MNRRKDSRSRFNFKAIVKMWLSQHAQALIFSLGQLFRHPLGTLLTVSVIGISLALPAGFYLLLENLQVISSKWEDSSDISLFLRQGYTRTQADSLAARIGEHDDINSVTIIDRDQALEEYRQLSGFDAALDLLDDNPLPFVLVIKPDLDEMGAAASDELLLYLRSLPEVDAAQFDQQWIRRLFLIMDIFQRAIFILAVILAVAVLLIIGNTIRLAIYNRRQEIEINKLFGATDAFIRRPFLYYGILHGIGGALVATVLLELSVALLRAPVTRLSGLYNSSFELSTLHPGEIGVLACAGALLGLLGAWLSVYRHTKSIDPI